MGTQIHMAKPLQTYNIDDVDDDGDDDVGGRTPCTVPGVYQGP